MTPNIDLKYENHKTVIIEKLQIADNKKTDDFFLILKLRLYEFLFKWRFDY